MKINLSSRLTLLMVLSAMFLGACGTAKESLAPTPTNTMPSPAQTGETVRVGILVAVQSMTAVNEQYGDLMAYLSKATGRPFTIVPLTNKNQLPSVEQQGMEFLFTNPLAAVQARRIYGVDFLVTLSRPDSGTKFSALIIARKDGNIQSVEDMRGKRAAGVSFTTAAAGGVFQAYELLQKGFDPFKDFGSLVELSPQENIVLGVLNGTLDVGFVRTGLLEDMQKAGTITQADVDALEIVNAVEDGFFYQHSTALYPEWPFAALAETDPELSEAVRAALLAIPPGDPALASAKITGFVPAEDYSSLDKLIETLKLPGWDAVPNP
ncbi:MAG: phosphate/phosphite/phosphonate ABC transporter substrate-binding protein [Chloroflexota bacterium]